MPEFISRATADFVMRQMGYSVRKEHGQSVTYRNDLIAYEDRVALSFPDGQGIPEADFRRELSDYQGIPLAAVDAALEQV